MTGNFASDRAEFPPGHRLGHYEILDRRGRGGMGQVYRARDLNLDRIVALKCLRSELAGSVAGRRRFLREARSAAAVSHPNIVPVFDVIECDDAPWIVMEFVDGRDLGELVAEKRALGIDEVLALAEGIAEGLCAAHDRRILHRDLKPGNIIVDTEGRARLTDFGLAKALLPEHEPDSAPTRGASEIETGKVVGTRGYQSPEQALGRPVDRRSDIFSLGVVLYEMCTGSPPFVASSDGGRLDAILHRDPPSLDLLNPDVPADLARIIHKCLAKIPDDRYQDCRDLLVDLRNLRRTREGGDWRELPSPPPRRTEDWPGRWRWLPVPAAVLVLVAGGAAAWWAIGWHRPPGLGWEGAPRQVTSLPGWEAGPALSPDGTMVAYASDASGNSDIWVVDVHGGDPIRLTDSPASDRDPAWFPDGSALAFVSERSGHEAIWKVGRLGGSATMLLPDAIDPAISPDGRWVAFSRATPRGAYRIAIAPLHRPEEAVFLTDQDDGLWDHVQPAWSPDGRRICYAAFRDLWIVSVDEKKPRRLTTDGQMDLAPAWSSDGQSMFFSSQREGTLAIWRVPINGGKPVRITYGNGPESHVSISRDGAVLAYSTVRREPRLVLRNLVTREESELPGSRQDYAPAIAPDGRGLAFASDRWAGRQDLWFQPISGGRPLGPPQRLTDNPGSSQYPAYSPDGRWIAFWRVLEGQRDVWVMPAGGGPPQRITDDPAPDYHPAWSPDGRWLAFSSDRDGHSHIWVVQVRDGRPVGDPRRVTSGDTTDLAPAWSPDGTRIAYMGAGATGGDIWIADVQGNAPPRKVTAGASVDRVRYDYKTGDLIVSGIWEKGQVSLRRVNPDGGAPRPLDPPVVFGQEALYRDFDYSRDGSLLAFSKEHSEGDIWVQEARAGSF